MHDSEYEQQMLEREDAREMRQEAKGDSRQDTPKDNPTTEQILEERGRFYGAFSGHARITLEMQALMYEHMKKYNQKAHHLLSGFGDVNRDTSATINEGLHMILHKLGRLANGDITYIDSWDDIAGYAKLVANYLREEKNF